MGENSCQPEGLQPESAMAALLVLAIKRLLPSPGALPSPILAATHTCFMVLRALSTNPKQFTLGPMQPLESGLGDADHLADLHAGAFALVCIGSNYIRLHDDRHVF